MRYLTGEEAAAADTFLEAAGALARQYATCRRARCGAVIVADNTIIGSGFNSPAGGLESQRRCHCEKSALHPKVTDKTCCVHAEQRAIFDALRHQPDRLEGSVLYFIRLDGRGQPEPAGRPYCTICSKMALDVGIRGFVLRHAEGLCLYDTQVYNLLSLAYAA